MRGGTWRKLFSEQYIIFERKQNALTERERLELAKSFFVRNKILLLIKQCEKDGGQDGQYTIKMENNKKQEQTILP